MARMAFDPASRSAWRARRRARALRDGGAGPARQRGAVAVLVGLTIAVLIGFLGLAVDLGRLFVVKSEVQSAMDACALAAASQLRPGLNDPASLDRAIAYGRTPANRVDFQAQAIDAGGIEFSFSEHLGGPYTTYSYGAGGASALANSAKYARCTYPVERIPVFFMRVLNSVTESTVAATAVATLAPSQTNCAFPISVCRDSTASASASPPWGLAPGSWVAGLGEPGGGGGGSSGGSGSGPLGCTSGTGTGNFCWASFSPGASSSSYLANLIKGTGQCDLSSASQVGGTGNMSSLNQAWNTRFGIYHPSEPKPPTGTAFPDFTGYSYTAANWPSQSNAYPDYRAKRAARAKFNSDSGVNIHPGNEISSSEHSAYGRDRRLVLAPIVNCSTYGGGGTHFANIDDWACVLLLSPINTQGPSVPAKVEYLGLASAPNSPCATSGLAGGTAGPLVPVLVQ